MLRARWWARLSVLVTAACLGLGAPGLSSAEPTDAERAAAKQAFEEGLELEKKGDYENALGRFFKVGEFKMTPHVRFHIALCEEKLGKLVSAMRGFELAEAEALKMGKDAQVVAEKAPERAEALRKRIASVRIEVKGRILYSRVLIDGQPVPEKDFGTLVPVDPGKHTISVDTDGVTTQSREVTLAEKGYETIQLEIDDPEKPVPTATASVSETTSATAPPPPPPPSRVPAFVLGGAGVASLIGAGVFYGLRVGALGELEEKCPAPAGGGGRVCPPEAKGALDDAQTFTIAAGVMVGVGVAALGGAGAYWFLTQRKPSSGPGNAPASGAGRSARQGRRSGSG
ncbi:MAG: hypothetical protein R3F14_38565 [Polyangiaceae bacterium]